MRWKLWGASVCACLAVGTVSAWAQSPPATLEERLAALERRVEQLEQENHQLKTQVARLMPDPAPGGVELASTSPDVAGAAMAPTAAVSSGLHPSASSQPRALATPAAQAAAEKLQTKSERVEIGGQIRFRAEVRQNADLSSDQSDARNFVGQRLRFHVRAKLSENVEAFAQFQDSRLWGQELSTASNDNLTDLHQGYVQVKDFLAPGLGLKVGRQEMAYGAERLIGAFGWDNIGRSFDAVKMGYSSNSVASDWFAAKVVDRRSTGRGDRDQYLYGAYNQFFRQRPQHLEVYGIFFRDGLRTAGEIATRGPKATGLMTLGARSDGALRSGINYDLEFAQQLGHRGFDTHRARAFAGKIFKSLEEAHKLRLGFEYDVATGDKDPADGRSGEFFNLFPTNHAHYGYADQMGWRNMQDFRAMFSVTPAPPLKFDFDYHNFFLLEARGPWKNAGGAVLGFDPTGQSGKHVGDELDFTVAFPIQKHLKILSGYSLFLPGEFARQTRGPDNQHFFYLQTLVDF
ncbi:MAG TPA: alginate export family protein [Terriglobia bacterium]|nr:alginate export family protein [Terriglobia bacterium]